MVNTYRDPKVIGGVTGHIRLMARIRHLGGKCTDLNALGSPAPSVFRHAIYTGFVSRIRQPGKVSARAGHYEGSTLPGGVLRSALQLDSGRSRGRAQGRPRGSNGSPASARPRACRSSAENALRFLEMNCVALNTAGDSRLAPETAKPLSHFIYPYPETTKGPLAYYNSQNVSAREVELS